MVRKSTCREGEAPAEPQSLLGIERLSGSAGASPSQGPKKRSWFIKGARDV
jgi:hypothetical protein